jgi:hypothetical protein
VCPAVPFPSHLVGPAWSPCQQVSGTNDEGSWAAQHFSKCSISDGACRMDSLYRTCPIAIVKQVIDCLHGVGCSVFCSHVDGRLERLSMQQYSSPCCRRLWWLLVDSCKKVGFLIVCSSNSRIKVGKEELGMTFISCSCPSSSSSSSSCRSI